MSEPARSASPEQERERMDSVRSVLDAHATLSLAASDEDGPWVARVFFADDEPEPGRLDLCLALLASSRKLAMIRRSPRVAFLIASDVPDRWVQGSGDAEIVEDARDADAIGRALYAKSDAAEPFLSRVTWRGVRIHVRDLKLTDVSMHPPVAQMSFR